MSEATRATTCPTFQDSLPIETLEKGLKENIEFLKTNSRGPSVYQFGDRVMSRTDYVLALEYLSEKIHKEWNTPELQKTFNEQFECFEVYGGESWGNVFVTSYFEPLLLSSRKQTAKHSQPLYRIPPNMVLIQMDEFFQTFPTLRENMKNPNEQRTPFSVLRGRLEASKNSDEPPTIHPFYDRKGIDQDYSLKKQKIEIAWVDPIDAFFLQIQGSGTLEYSDRSKVRVGYAGQNGHKYEALGKFLTDVIPLESMTMHTIEEHLRTLPKDQLQTLLNKNPSYVFFKKLDSKAITYLGTPVIARRTIATDQRFFQKGSLAYLEIEEPVFEKPTDTIPKEWVAKPRFVIDQDTGGAIRGGGRVDLFWGEGAEARQAAGVMKSKGRLVYIAPKQTLLDQLIKTKPK